MRKNGKGVGYKGKGSRERRWVQGEKGKEEDGKEIREKGRKRG